jgi:hypothetical protein
MLLPPPALSQWRADLRLSPESDSARTSYTNARCVAANGDTVHAVWQGKPGSNWHIFHRRSLDGGVTWDESSRVSDNTGANAAFPAIAIDGSNVCVIWDDDRAGNSDIYFRRSSDAGLTWSSEQRLTDNPGRQYASSIVFSDRTLHVAWTDSRHGNGEIYYRRSDDGGEHWGQELRLTDNWLISEAPCLAASGSSIHLAWYDARFSAGFDVMYRRSRDGGVTWDEEMRLTDDPFTQNGMSIAADGADVHVVWHDIRTNVWDVHYKRSSDGGDNWGDDVPIVFTATNAWFPSVAVSGPAVHVVWSDDRDGVYRIMYKHSNDRGDTWSEDAPLSGATGDLKYPSISLSGPCIDVVWSDARNGLRNVYYTRNPTGNMVSSANHDAAAPTSDGIALNYPNPFSTATGIVYTLSGTERVLLTVHDAFGRLVATLVDAEMTAGTHTAELAAASLPAGAYLCRLHAGRRVFGKTVTCTR